MAAVIDQPVSADTPTRHTRRALSAGLTRLQKRALKALGYIVLVYLLYRLPPALKQALHTTAKSQPAPKAVPQPAPKAAPKPAPPVAKPTPPANNGIPQDNGGDGDSDNNGGPSDGDGNI